VSSASPAARPLLAALAALAACGVPAAPEPCPGDPLARLVLRATVVEGAACAAAAGVVGAEPIAAFVSYTGAASAALCLDRALAAPLTGTRAGDAIEVATPARPAAAPDCGCAVQVVERVTGTVTRGAGGEVTGFSGELVNELAPADGAASCVPSGVAAACPVPCTARWTLAAP
jgi:hypothetical protein